MTRSDVATIIVIYAVCVLFLYLTLQLRPAAQVYPLCLIAGLALLDTLFLADRLRRMYREKASTGAVRIFNDFPETFKNFRAGQFTFVIGACIAYIILLYFAGFYLSSFLYMLVVLLFLRVRPLPMALTIFILGTLVYCVFTLFLNVPLPRGYLFS